MGPVMHQLGDDWEIIEAAVLFEMKLMVFARKRLHDQIGCLEITSEGTRTGYLIGNKGGMLVRSKINGTSVAFVCCQILWRSMPSHSVQDNLTQVMRCKYS